MPDKVITSQNEFDELNLDLDIPELKDVEESTPIDKAASEETDELILSIDELETTPVETKEAPKETIKDDLKKESIEDIDIDLDIEESPTDKVIGNGSGVALPELKEETKSVEKVAEQVVATEPVADEPAKVTEPKKRGRKPKVKVEDTTVASVETKPIETKSEESTKVELNKETLILDPIFDISLIDTSKYQTRAILHTEDEIEALKEHISNQGQIEPVHVYLDGLGKYHLLAGFKRHAAISALKHTTIKAIIHTNLTEEQCVAISSGTNTERTELSDYDKIRSVGMFAKKNPLVDIDSIVRIFGFAKSTVYQYISFFKYFDKYPEYDELFSKYRLPFHIFSTIFKSLSEENIDIKKIIGIVEDKIMLGRIDKKSFEYEFNCKFAEEKLENKLKQDEENTKIDIDIDVNGEVEDKAVEKIINGQKDRIENEDNETSKKKQQVNEIVDKMLKNLDDLALNVSDLLAFEKFKSYTDSDKIGSYIKRIMKISEMNVKLI